MKKKAKHLAWRLAKDGNGALPGLRPWEAVARGVLPLALLAAAGCGGETEAVRYRATAAVVVDGKLYEGSTVRETRFTSTPGSLTGMQASIKDAGDAIRIDVGEGRSAIYLLLNDRGGGAEFPLIVWQCFEIDTENNPKWIDELRETRSGQKCTVTPGGLGHVMPLLVAFADEAQPKSIFEVAPESFKSAFGVEARFAQLTLERVNDTVPIDRRIAKHLPWLANIPFDGTNLRVLDPHIPVGLLAKDATLAQTVADYYFKE